MQMKDVSVLGRAAALLVLLLALAGCQKRVSHTSTGEKVYGDISLLTETLYEAVEGKNGIGRGAKVNYRNMHFDRQGRLTETVHYWKHQVIQREVFSFGDDGRLTGGEVYGGDGALLGSYSYRFDENGRVAEQELVSKEGRILWKNVFRYDGEGRPVEQTTYDTDGAMLGRTLTTYDAGGRPAATETFASDGSADRRLEHTYESFDDNGNWIRRVDRSKGAVVSLMDREMVH